MEKPKCKINGRNYIKCFSWNLFTTAPVVRMDNGEQWYGRKNRANREKREMDQLGQGTELKEARVSDCVKITKQWIFEKGIEEKQGSH